MAAFGELAMRLPAIKLIALNLSRHTSAALPPAIHSYSVRMGLKEAFWVCPRPIQSTLNAVFISEKITNRLPALEGTDEFGRRLANQGKTLSHFIH